MTRTGETDKSEWREKWNLRAKALIGRTIVEARYLTDAECQQQGWGRSTLAILLDNGMTVYPMADDEGNDAGSMMVVDQVGKAIEMPTIPF